jgi:crotonobetainyl-CoA:carnitine CoA-transferase CaiB-like acyl-CoA transferase
MPLPGLPFRFSGVDRWLRAPAPTLGRDNDTVLGDLLGLDAAARAALAEACVVGTWPEGLGGS